MARRFSGKEAKIDREILGSSGLLRGFCHRVWRPMLAPLEKGVTSAMQCPAAVISEVVTERRACQGVRCCADGDTPIGAEVDRLTSGRGAGNLWRA